MAVDHPVVCGLLDAAPLLDAVQLQHRWETWGPEEQDTYNRLRRAALRWLGLGDDGKGRLEDRIRAASWAADRTAILH